MLSHVTWSIRTGCHMWSDHVTNQRANHRRLSYTVWPCLSAIFARKAQARKVSGFWLLFLVCMARDIIFLHIWNVTFENFTCDAIRFGTCESFKFIYEIKPFQAMSEMDGRTQVQSDPLLERIRQLTFNSDGVYRFDDHKHANAENSYGFDTIGPLYAEEDSRQHSGKFVFKFQNKPRKGKKNRLSSIRHQIPQTVKYETWNWSIRISLGIYDTPKWPNRVARHIRQGSCDAPTDIVPSIFDSLFFDFAAIEVPRLTELAAKKIKHTLPRGQPQTVLSLPLPKIWKQHLLDDKS